VEPFLGEEPLQWREIVDVALAEDIGLGDATRFAVPDEAKASYVIEAQANGILCGIGLAFDVLTPAADPDQGEYCAYKLTDGAAIKQGTVVMDGRLLARDLVRNERVALNFLMHMSGIATLTRQFVDSVKGTRAKILDTRKTVPGIRSLQKYAVRVGGGHNHRFNLSDGVLIKDNHIRIAGGVKEAINRVKAGASPMLKIEVECETVAQVDRALRAGADIILLDNMPVGEIKDAVSICQNQAVLEVSGGVTLENVRAIAETGVDYISVGALTHSVTALPFHLEVQ
jgi:nicotinate-nucleotide pyrophosphorylase (carboxylating)